MNEEEYFEQLCSNSVDGTLTDSEKQKLEEHLAECPSCAALKEDLKQMHSMLAVDETEPPAGLHDSIMERLQQEETVRVVAPQKPMRVCRCSRWWPLRRLSFWSCSAAD